MRIVQVVETLELGGLERMAVELAIQHKAAGHESSLYTIFSGGPLVEVAASAGIPVRSFHKVPGFSPKTIWVLTRALRMDSPEIVHSHTAGIHHYAAAAARLAGVPVVVNTRHSPSASLLRPYQDRYFRWVLPLTSGVAVVSKATLDLLVARGLCPDKMRVIWNGTQTSEFRLRPATPGSKRPLIRFGTIGRFVPEKAHSILLKAFRILLDRFPTANLKIVGYGPLADSMQAQISQLGLTSSVIIEGKTDDVPQILSQLDVFVLSSISEGLPMAVIEAMAAGLPIVSTRVGGVPEVAQEGKIAWYCQPADADSLAELMWQAATSVRLREMGANAAEFAVRNLDISAMQKKYEQMYLEFL